MIEPKAGMVVYDRYFYDWWHHYIAEYDGEYWWALNERGDKVCRVTKLGCNARVIFDPDKDG